MKTYVYNAAGGNATAINFGQKIARSKYAKINEQLQAKSSEIEQVGFFEQQNGVPKLQMAGGEFCGNATRGFACLLAELNPEESAFDFYVSGFSEKVQAKIQRLGDKRFFCEARFCGMKAGIIEKNLYGDTVKIVDLGGIIHILVDENKISFSESDYESTMKKIKDDLSVDCDAVGVLWLREEGEKVYMKPVVWVKAIDTCYYETSCGSGSIAIGLAKGEDIEVLQPSGKAISVRFDGEVTVLSSEMERVMEF